MSDNKILGYTPEQVEAVSNELQNTIMDLINLSTHSTTQIAVDTVVTGLGLRVAILEGLITSEEGEKLVDDTDGDFKLITQELQNRAFAKSFGV